MENDLKQAKALFFDYFGTVVDWLSPITNALVENAPAGRDVDWKEFAFKWRSSFFTVAPTLGDGNSVTFEEVQRRCLLESSSNNQWGWSEDQINNLVQSWVLVVPWEDSALGLRKLRQKYICSTLSNGSTRLLVDASKRQNMEWDMFFASDLLQGYKPAPEVYQRAMKVLRLDPHECIMVAAHAYDLKAAAALGMKTIYIPRATEDLGVNLDEYRFDKTISSGGLMGLASVLID